MLSRGHRRAFGSWWIAGCSGSARIAQVHGFSAHADRDGLLDWLGALKTPPRRVFLTHGEEDSANALSAEITARWGCSVEVPEYQAEYELE